MYVNEQMTTREEKKKEKALNELRASTMPIYTLNLKHRSQKKYKEKRLSASRVGHKGLKRINTCFNKKK